MYMYGVNYVYLYFHKNVPKIENGVARQGYPIPNCLTTPPPLLAQINIKSLPKLCMKSHDDQHKLKQNLPTVGRGHPPSPLAPSTRSD